MRRLDFPQAWRIADAVLAARDPATRDDPRVPYHLRWVWDGTPPDGRHVLVRCYHGLGDVLQFMRFLPVLAARAASVTVETPRALCVLFADMHAIPFDPAAPLPPSECDIEIMELGHALRLPPPLPALGGWRGGAAVGLCWQAGEWDPRRSIPLAALLDAVGTSPLVSLQRGTAASEADGRFLNPGDTDDDVLRTMTLIAGCRHVVTIDTMVAHLAGAMGAPTLLLLHAECDWRWQHGVGRSAWYPSITMVRQGTPGDWTGPLRAAATFNPG